MKLDYDAISPITGNECVIVEADQKTSIITISFLNIPGVGMLYCSGKSQRTMRWEVASTVEIVGEERLKFPIPGKEGEYFTSKLDTDNAQVFKKHEFENALDHFYSLVNKVYAQ